jgi:hypothetical protein
MLTDLFLLPLLSGQVVDMPNGKLDINPMFKAPYVLPVLISNCEGSIEVTADGKMTLAVAFGALQLPVKGLSVSGSACPHAVDLKAGESMTWG